MLLGTGPVKNSVVVKLSPRSNVVFLAVGASLASVSSACICDGWSLRIFNIVEVFVRREDTVSGHRLNIVPNIERRTSFLSTELVVASSGKYTQSSFVRLVL